MRLSIEPITVKAARARVKAWHRHLPDLQGGAKNACSKLYGAICRAGQALGYREAWTYTLPDEPGASLRAAGFADMGVTAGGEHDREKRPRKPARHPEPKRRWMRRLA